MIKSVMDKILWKQRTEVVNSYLEVAAYFTKFYSDWVSLDKQHFTSFEIQRKALTVLSTRHITNKTPKVRKTRRES